MSLSNTAWIQYAALIKQNEWSFFRYLNEKCLLFVSHCDIKHQKYTFIIESELYWSFISLKDILLRILQINHTTDVIGQPSMIWSVWLSQTEGWVFGASSEIWAYNLTILAGLANLPAYFYLNHYCSNIVTIQVTHLTCSTFWQT